jgi:ABC-type Fe3+/spermidine/putrescine transport system ATPase subunit
VLSDQVLVMRDGIVQQCGTARDIFKWPVNRFVADFVGFTNFIPATIVDRGSELTTVRVGSEGPTLKLASSEAVLAADDVVIATRPAALRLRPGSDGQGITGEVVSQAYLGDVIEVHVQVGDLRVIAHVPESTGPGAGMPKLGDQVTVELDPAASILVKAV